MIDHKINGYIATYQSAKDLAAGIRWVLSEADYTSLSEKAVEKVRSYYSEWIVAGQYVDLYTSVLR
jgi:glycosyltransferase involved in cell wall biosynthesis